MHGDHISYHPAVWRNSPSDIVVTAHFPGSPSANVTWSFQGNSSDLSHFSVVIRTGGEKPYQKDVPSGNRELLNVIACF